MFSRTFFVALFFSLFMVTHASPSLALHFTQDSFVFNAGHSRANTTVELSGIDPASFSPLTIASITYSAQ